MAQDIARIDAILNLAPVVPVLTLDDPETAVAVGRALECIRALATLEGAVVGAGTVLDGFQAKSAAEAGARFLVSPGATAKLIADAETCGVPLLPGVATASEAMAMLERGYSRLKFFPAESAGGAAHLRSLAAPLPALRFCPTGGIDRAKALTYLRLPNVACVGGSWAAPIDAIRVGGLEPDRSPRTRSSIDGTLRMTSRDFLPVALACLSGSVPRLHQRRVGGSRTPSFKAHYG